MSKQAIKVVMDDLFGVGDNSVLFHACNTKGSWGAGIATAFKQHYPNAYQIYNRHCITSTPSKLIGTCLLIPPQAGDVPRKHYIACLFTSKNYGKRKDTPQQILEATEEAFGDLIEDYADLRAAGKVPDGGLVGCKINSARFAVPWDDTVSVLKEVMRKKGFEEDITVYTIEEGEKGDDSGGSDSRGSSDINRSAENDHEQETDSDTEPITSKISSVVPSKRRRSSHSASSSTSQHSQTSSRSLSPSPQLPPRYPERSPSPIDYNNLPYKAPVVVPLLKRPSKYGCMVRDGPIGTPEGTDERFVLIAKKSFRGACAWRTRKARDKERAAESDVKEAPVNEEEDEEEDEDEDDLGEVELLWTVEGEEFILMRNPFGDDEKGLLASKQTHWVNKKYFET